MKKQWPREVVLVALCVMGAVCLYLFVDQRFITPGAAPESVSAPNTPLTAVVVMATGRVIPVELVNTDMTRARGLGGRSALDAGTGMLFRFEGEGIYPFWMKDMKFPIDIIWLSNGIVVDIAENMQPPVVGQDIPSYVPRASADTVLELNAGEARGFGISVGTQLKFR